MNSVQAPRRRRAKLRQRLKTNLLCSSCLVAPIRSTDDFAQLWVFRLLVFSNCCVSAIGPLVASISAWKPQSISSLASIRAVFRDLEQQFPETAATAEAMTPSVAAVFLLILLLNVFCIVLYFSADFPVWPIFVNWNLFQFFRVFVFRYLKIHFLNIALSDVETKKRRNALMQVKRRDYLGI